MAYGEMLTGIASMLFLHLNDAPCTARRFFDAGYANKLYPTADTAVARPCLPVVFGKSRHDKRGHGSFRLS